MPETPHPARGHEPERIYERDPDPAEAVDRPLEPRSSSEPLHATDEPVASFFYDSAYNEIYTPVGEPDPSADSDPYRTPTPEDDDEHASGTRGSGQGAEDQ